MKQLQLSTVLAISVGAIAFNAAIAHAETLHFQCVQGGSFEAQVRKDKAKIKLPSGETKKLLPVDSRIGEKFSDGQVMLYVNGSEAWVEVNDDKVYNNCLAHNGAVNSTLSSNQ